MIIIYSDHKYIEDALSSFFNDIKTVTCENDISANAIAIIDDKDVELESTRILISNTIKNSDMKKPFHISNLVNLINNKLTNVNNFFISKQSTFFFSKRVVINDKNKQIKLTEKESELLRYLITNPDKPFSKEHILKKIWGFNFDTHTFETHIYQLKNKLCDITIHISNNQVTYLTKK